MSIKLLGNSTASINGRKIVLPYEVYPEIEQLQSEVAALKKPIPCNVCLGEPLPNNKSCICNGAGTELAELQGFREALYNTEKENAAYKELLMECGATIEQLRTSYLSLDTIEQDGIDQLIFKIKVML